MDELTFLSVKLNVQVVIDSMKISIEELRKSPRQEQAKPYIDGMTKHIRNLNEAYGCFIAMAQEVRMLNKMNFNYHLESMQYKHEIEKLKAEIEELKKFI
jgi:hypothetical protein